MQRCKGFIKGREQGKVAGCEANFACVHGLTVYYILHIFSYEEVQFKCFACLQVKANGHIPAEKHNGPRGVATIRPTKM